MQQPYWKQHKRSSAWDILKWSGIVVPYVDLNYLTRYLGVALYQADLGEVEGLCNPAANPAEILYNSKHHPHRQRFTIAHEIGHLILHDSTNKFRDTQNTMNSKSYVEVQANKFANDLLMPKPFIDNYIRTLSNIDELSEVFYVSENEIVTRLKDLGYLKF